MRLTRLVLAALPLAVLFSCGDDAVVPDEDPDAGSDATTEDAPGPIESGADAEADASGDADAEASFVRDDHEVLFVQRGTFALWKMRPDGGDPVQVIEKDTLGHTWAEGYRRIVYVSTADGGPGVLVSVLPDGGDARTIFQGERPAWSDVAGRIFFTLATVDLFSALPDGGDVRQLTNTGRVYGTPAVAPDGVTIASRTQGQLRLIFADGGVLSYGDYSAPDWHPDGRLIVAYKSNSTFDSRIVVIDVATGSATEITKGGFFDFVPRWSPDGKEIVFTRGPGSGSANGEIHIMNADGTNVRKLTNGLQAQEAVWR